jgi:hypothetical protein
MMSGVPPESRSVNDHAYEALFLITLLNELVFIPLCLGYLIVAGFSLRVKFRRRKREQ